jgi:hypothetical protein
MPGGATHVHFSVDLFIADLWALRVLLNDWWRRYQDPDADLPELDLTFHDVVPAERAGREGEEYRQAEAYWRDRLDDLPAASRLPADTSAAAPHFTRRTARIDTGTWSRVKELAAARGVTASGVLLAAYSVVLGAWSAQDRFCVDVTLFNRPPVHRPDCRCAARSTPRSSQYRRVEVARPKRAAVSPIVSIVAFMSLFDAISRV